MRAVSEIADWWDQQHRESKQELDRFVDNNPNLFGVLVATAVSTSMTVGAGFVDVLRFGEGMAQGGVRGFGKDALRLIGLAGPLGRGAKMLQTAANARLARFIVDPGGGICGWLAGTQALRQTGTRAFAAVDDLARALGKTVADFGGTNMQTLVASLQQVGARLGAIKKVNSLDDVANLTSNNGGVTIFTVFGKRMEGGVLKSVGHAVYGFRDTLGRFRILDRGGSAGRTPQVFKSLDDLATKYGLQGEWAVSEAAVMENLFAKFVGSISSAPVLALDVFALAGINQIEHETVAQAFEVHKTVMRQGKKALERNGARQHVVRQGDWLSKIAKTYYGDMHKWPVIFEANRDVIGKNPDLIHPGQNLLIPALPKVRGISG